MLRIIKFLNPCLRLFKCTSTRCMHFSKTNRKKMLITFVDTIQNQASRLRIKMLSKIFKKHHRAIQERRPFPLLFCNPFNLQTQRTARAQQLNSEHHSANTFQKAIKQIYTLWSWCFSVILRGRWPAVSMLILLLILVLFILAMLMLALPVIFLLVLTLLVLALLKFTLLVWRAFVPTALLQWLPLISIVWSGRTTDGWSRHVSWTLLAVRSVLSVTTLPDVVTFYRRPFRKSTMSTGAVLHLRILRPSALVILRTVTHLICRRLHIRSLGVRLVRTRFRDGPLPLIVDLTRTRIRVVVRRLGFDCACRRLLVALQQVTCFSIVFVNAVQNTNWAKANGAPFCRRSKKAADSMKLLV